ncbi:hypothetical protein [Phytoactinopolyspora halophila]|uniref:hypothetical protein n=1 Tax=Phytoactinopolyspora halophila TaxID=1981511 RepID=UPI001314E62D|nr:hypothetical protein [Phytoactinopolyspora halophila]
MTPVPHREDQLRIPFAWRGGEIDRDNHLAGLDVADGADVSVASMVILCTPARTA